MNVSPAARRNYAGAPVLFGIGNTAPSITTQRGDASRPHATTEGHDSRRRTSLAALRPEASWATPIGHNRAQTLADPCRHATRSIEPDERKSAGPCRQFRETGATGLEPATSRVTSRRSNRLSSPPKRGTGSMASARRRRLCGDRGGDRQSLRRAGATVGREDGRPSVAAVRPAARRTWGAR